MLISYARSPSGGWHPATMQVWPQWRSALIWDFWAITSYLIFSIIFWYVGVLPDLATLRDRSRGGWQKIYGAFALGWRGSARHWRHYHKLQITLAALATPLVCSVHSIVGLDFAASLMPGWREPIFPPYFVVGAMYSGFAVVVMLAALISRNMGLHALITPRHFEAMAKIMLMAAIVMGLSYASEWFTAWYGGNPADRDLVVFEFTGAYAETLLGDVDRQRRHSPDPVAAFDANEPSGADRRVGRRADRHVARAHPHCLEHAVAQLSPVDGPRVLPTSWDWVSVRTHLLLLLALSPLLPVALPVGRRCTTSGNSGGARLRHERKRRPARHRRIPGRRRSLRGGAQYPHARLRSDRRINALPSRGLDDILRLDDLPIRWPMLIAALGVAAAAYAVEFWSAVYAYPHRLGRPAPQ